MEGDDWIPIRQKTAIIANQNVVQSNRRPQQPMNEVTTLISIINGCIDRYKTFCSLRLECRSFRNLLLAVLDVLYDIQQRLDLDEGCGSGLENTELSAPSKLLQDAIKDGEKVLEECTKEKKVRALVFGKEYLENLNRASKDIHSALAGLLSASGVSVQAEISLSLIQDIVTKLDRQVLDNNHEVAELVRSEVQQGNEGLLERLATKLVERRAVTDQEDLKDQLQAIQQDEVTFLSAKVIYDRQLLELVLTLSLAESRREPTGTGSNNDASRDDFLKCPLSKEIMRDPVLLTASGITYDREYLCKSLLENPNLEPKTNERFDQPLEYVDNVTVRSIITDQHRGSGVYERYNDATFLAEYDASWQNMKQECKASPASSFGVSSSQEEERTSTNNAGPPPAPTYDEIGALLCGMNTLKIDPGKAQRLLNESQGGDAVTAAFQADLLDPNGINFNDVVKSDSQSLQKWSVARDLGLKLDADSGNAWAQALVGRMYADGRGVVQDYEEAVWYFRLASDQGYGNAQFALGVMYGKGLGVPQDDEVALWFFRLSADQGHASAQYNLGAMHYHVGLGVPQDDDIRHSDLAANQGQEEAPSDQSSRDVNGHDAPHNYDEAVRFYRLAANQEFPIAQFSLGGMFANGRGVPQDDEEAARYFRLAADRGHAEAQWSLGRMYANGQGVPQDNDEAVRCYQLAADQGDDQAQHCIDALCLNVQIVPLDSPTPNVAPSTYDVIGAHLYGMNCCKIDFGGAQRLLNECQIGDAVAAAFQACLLDPKLFNTSDVAKSDTQSLQQWSVSRELGLIRDADSGNAWAQALTGTMYNLGRGVPRDYKEADRYYHLASDQGHANAHCNLGVMYEHGQGIQSYEAAAWHYRLAAEQGHAQAQCNLGVMCAHGQGVPQDYKEAVRWYTLAGVQGFQRAQHHLSIIYANGQDAPTQTAAPTYDDIAALLDAPTETSAPTYDNIAALLYGMNCCKIDYGRAQRILNESQIEDAVAAAFQACLLDPCGFKDTDVAKSKSQCLQQWTVSRELGLTRDADAGNAWAQALVGAMYSSGRSVPRDDKEGVRYLGLAAKQGHATAQSNLGFMCERGRGLPQNSAAAVRYYRLAAEQGHAQAQCNLGALYENGQVVPQPYTEAVRYYRLAAEQGNAHAQYNLGVMYAKGRGVTKDYKEALRYYRLAADQGRHDLAQYNIGSMYKYGAGVRKDAREADRRYELAADQGLAVAQYKRGNMYRKGQGVRRQDYKEAVRHYQLAADQGHAAAQLALGTMYQRGYGVARCYEEAFRFYQLAANQGNAKAQVNLGGLYDTGRGIPRDLQEALRYYRLAADQGLLRGIMKLGVCRVLSVFRSSS